MKDSLYIIIPAYNEQANIDELINEWYPVIEGIHSNDSRLVIIDDGSTDDTYRLLNGYSVSRPLLTVLHKENGGHGDTLLFGYRYAIRNGSDYIFQTDSDGQTKASEFQDFWNQRMEYDAIIGYRRKRGDGLKRKLIEDVLCLILFCIFRVRVPDANAPFRLMRSSKVDKYISKMPEHYNLPNVMLTVFFVSNNDKLLFREISFGKRHAGNNKLNYRKIAGIGCRAVHDFIRFRSSL